MATHQNNQNNRNTRLIPVNFDADIKLRHGVPPQPSVGQRLAWFLRRLATRFDGKQAVVIECSVDPCLSRDKIGDCLMLGFREARRLMADEAKAKAIEHIMQREHPALYQSNTTNRTES